MLSYVKDPICLHIVFTSYRLVRLCGRYHGTTVIRGQWHDDGDDDDEGVERNGSNGCGLCRPSLRRSLLEICCSQRSKVVENVHEHNKGNRLPIPNGVGAHNKKSPFYLQ